MSRLTALLSWLEQRPGRVLVAIGCAFVVLYVTALTVFPRDHGRILNGDAIQYYAYLRSLAVDGDVDFTNDYALLYDPAGDGSAARGTVPETGRPPNFFSIGPALLWAPFFLAVALGAVLLGVVGVHVELGVAAPFPLSAGVAGIVYCTAGVYLCYDSCRRLYSAPIAFWAAVIGWLATPAVYYSLVSPAYSHATSLFAVSLFVHTWLRTRTQDTPGRYARMGAAAGLVALVRWQDVVVLILPLAELAFSLVRRERTLTHAVTRAAALVPPLALVFLPQVLAWRAIFGEFMVMPQGSGFMRWTEPALLSVLFSINHGLFSWTPAILLAVLGFRSLLKRDAVLGWSACLVGLIAVYVNAAVTDWWAGEAFGARRFVGYGVFVVFGFAALLTTTGASLRVSRGVAIGLVGYNLLLLLQYQLFMRGLDALAPYPTTWQTLFVERLVVPWRLVSSWLASG